MRRKGVVTKVQPELSPRGFLLVKVRICSALGTQYGATGGFEYVRMLSHLQVAAILPRSILLGEARDAPLSLLETIEPILCRMVEGRTVEFGADSDGCRLEGWQGIRFVERETAP